jgi:hypothetical protein
MRHLPKQETVDDVVFQLMAKEQLGVGLVTTSESRGF